MKAGKKRFKSLDIARGIAILSIILGHSGNKLAEAITFTYHVPVFVLLSGCFLSADGSWKEFLKKKAKTLLVPYLVTSLLVIVFAWVYVSWFYGVKNGLEAAGLWLGGMLYGSGVNVSAPVEVSRIGAIWFLLALFEGQIWTRAILRLPSFYQPLAVGLSVLAGALVPKGFQLPFSLGQSFFFVFYLYLGHLGMKLYPFYQKWPLFWKRALMLLCFAGWLDFIVHFQGFALVSSFCGRPLLDFMESLLASLSILYLSGGLEKISPFSQVLQFLGRNSIGLLCIHTIELNIYPWHWLWNLFESLHWPLDLSQLGFSLVEIFIDVLVLWILLHFTWFQRLFSLKPDPDKAGKEKARKRSSFTD